MIFLDMEVILFRQSSFRNDYLSNVLQAWNRVILYNFLVFHLSNDQIVITFEWYCMLTWSQRYKDSRIKILQVSTRRLIGQIDSA